MYPNGNEFWMPKAVLFVQCSENYLYCITYGINFEWQKPAHGPLLCCGDTDLSKFEFQQGDCSERLAQILSY